MSGYDASSKDGMTPSGPRVIQRVPLPRFKYSGATSDRLLVRFLFWLAICFLCAGTSLLWAFSGWHPGGVLIGVIFVAVIYTYVSGTDVFRRWRRNPRIERALRIGFGLRIMLEIIFPVGGAMDMLIGIIERTDR